jgi:hypothetical protein
MQERPHYGRLAPNFSFTLIFAHLVAHHNIEQLDEGLTAVDDGLVRGAKRRAVGEAELYRIRGQLLLAGECRTTLVDSCFRQALNVARRLQAKTYELRQQSRNSGVDRQERDAQTLLTEVIDAWPEELQTADLLRRGAFET